MPFFFRLIGIVPLGVGLTLICALWWPDSFFDFAPPFFKLIGSFVALMFILVGGGFLSGIASPQNQLQSMLSELQKRQRNQSLNPESQVRTPGEAGYQCSACGATLAQNADVSPHGDVKCEHCGRWFNIHQ